MTRRCDDLWRMPMPSGRDVLLLKWTYHAKHKDQIYNEND